jgi:hypothetical protein
MAKHEGLQTIVIAGAVLAGAFLLSGKLKEGLAGLGGGGGLGGLIPDFKIGDVLPNFAFPNIDLSGFSSLISIPDDWNPKNWLPDVIPHIEIPNPFKGVGKKFETLTYRTTPYALIPMLFAINPALGGASAIGTTIGRILPSVIPALEPTTQNVSGARIFDMPVVGGIARFLARIGGATPEEVTNVQEIGRAVNKGGFWNKIYSSASIVRTKLGTGILANTVNKTLNYTSTGGGGGGTSIPFKPFIPKFKELGGGYYEMLH